MGSHVQPGGEGERRRYPRRAHHIHDAPHAGIILTGNEHLIEFNNIHHLAQETGDVGAIYVGRDYTERGAIIRHNYIHDLGGVGFGSMAVYLDDCSSGITVEGNIFYNLKYGAFVGGGRDNRIHNNVFVSCNPAIRVDARASILPRFGRTWSTTP
jgi:parallel beta-helix repeat protein